MCLAMPAQVVTLLEEEQAIVSLGGIEKQISLTLLDKEINIGDFVIVHVGYALTRLDEAEAKKTLALFMQMQQTEENTK